MRSLVLAAVLAGVLAGVPSAAEAQEVVVRLKVGETQTGFGTVRPICDAPSVAVIAGGVLKAVGPGETLCSVATVQAQGTRQLYRVIVTAEEPARGGGEGRSER